MHSDHFVVVTPSGCRLGTLQYFAKLDVQRDEEDFYWGALQQAVNAAQYDDCADLKAKLTVLADQNLVHGVMKVGPAHA